MWCELVKLLYFHLPLYLSPLSFTLAGRKEIKRLTTRHKKKGKSDWYVTSDSTAGETHTFTVPPRLWACVCVHEVKHFQRLINQPLTWQLDWHLLHTHIHTHTHTHTQTHTLDIERQGDSLMPSALPETDNCWMPGTHTHIYIYINTYSTDTHTHTHITFLPTLIPKSRVITNWNMLTKQ